MGIVAPYISNLSSYPYLKPILQTDKVVNATIKRHIPTQIAGWDLSRLIPIMGLLIISSFLSNYILSLQKVKMRLNLKEFKTRAITKEQQTLVKKMEETIAKPGKLKEKNRQTLLKEFIQLKQELEKTGRNLSFLAIDVVDSTNMKLGEDPVIVENDFNQYHDFILCKFKEHGYIKAAWTPDGVMSCFNTTEQAFDAAKDILSSLPDFNKSTKMMKQDFHVRCGINTGFVYYDLSTPLEEFSDRVIDIAGHMQKHAPPDTVLVAKDLVKPIESHEVFTPTNNIVDGLEAFEWRTSK
ncbi:hypothetical protein [Legionella gratiana]|uniref:hypothetical protein n=1 Tax=Legionella gratiana TaxID=45066 RepID=UPI001EE6F679|nr:hypothetical protein [Legionella gratiana]